MKESTKNIIAETIDSVDFGEITIVKNGAKGKIDIITKTRKRVEDSPTVIELKDKSKKTFRNG